MGKFSTTKFDSLFAMEEEILGYWRENEVFKKTLEKNPADKTFSFYDGPPFITGQPHWGTLLPTIAKDIIPRYQTMKGFRVRRRWGWDVHGLPAENQVEKKLGLKNKRDIESLGIDKFIEECRNYVSEVSDSWRWYIDHIGRWTDMDDAYRTDDLHFMESVIRAFKELYDLDFIYRGRRVSLYCPRCATPLSKFEVTMDEDSYKMVDDPGVTVAFRLLGDETYLLAWTTTPWTLPANFALAVDPGAEYVRVTDGKAQYVMAHLALERYRDSDLEIVETFKGSKLVGQEYEPLYQFTKSNKDFDHRVYAAEFVTMSEGTGIVHVAPGFGEDDTKLGEKEGLSLFATLDEVGHFTIELGPFAGMYYKKADNLIIKDLEEKGLLFKKEVVTHSYPHCYRCGTPLIYKSQLAWYMKIDPLRQKLLDSNQEINWVPEHFGSGRFRHNLETAPDWSLSRTRYWGTPIPVWETEDGEVFVPGSIEELEKLSGQKITDLHRPKIDDVELTLPSGKKARRVKEVLDCWFESGAMPYAQDHYPFENKEKFNKHFPADFIVEYTGQLRGWFYYLHVLGNALKEAPAFKNVVVHGVVMGNDGRKMSKLYGNYPDPREVIEKYGAEAVRLFFMSSGVMRGEEMSVREEDIKEQSRVLNVLHNSFKYFLTYANLHEWKGEQKVEETNTLDAWIKLRLEEFIAEYAKGLDAFDFAHSTRAIRPFIEDLSTWYIRRSRDRFVEGDPEALQTLYHVLVRFSLAVAPTLPFSSELIFRTLTETESVHLADYPDADTVAVSDSANVLTMMDQVRSIASAVHSLRAANGLSLRQRLSSLVVNGFQDLANQQAFVDILIEETNVESVVFGTERLSSNFSEWFDLEGGKVSLDTLVTAELKVEGQYRELLRLLQDARKKKGLTVGQKVKLLYRANEEWEPLFRQRAEDIMKQASFTEIASVSDGTKLEDLGSDGIAIAFE